MEGLFLEVLKIILGFISGVAGGYIFAMFSLGRTLKKASQVMLRDRLRQSARYYTEHGITFAQKDDFEAMYKCYHELGKNGVMTVTYERVMQMTPKSDEV